MKKEQSAGNEKKKSKTEFSFLARDSQVSGEEFILRSIFLLLS